MVIENTGERMTDEQFKWFELISLVCAKGSTWDEAFMLLDNEMPQHIKDWMIERKKAIAAKKAAA